MDKTTKNNAEELSLIQAVEYFSLTPVQKEIAKKLWKANEMDTAENWKSKFSSKGIINQ